MASGSGWTPRQNKLFENGVATYDKDSPEFWNNLARAVGGKTVEEVKRHYERLVEDVRQIEAGEVPLPHYKNYSPSSSSSHTYIDHDDEQRIKGLKLQ